MSQKNVSALVLMVINDAAELEDGETGIDKCIEIYCKENNISDEICEQAQRQAFERGAREAGIPQSVIDGKTKLSDHFSEEYIQSQCPRKVGG